MKSINGHAPQRLSLLSVCYSHYCSRSYFVIDLNNKLFEKSIITFVAVFETIFFPAFTYYLIFLTLLYCFTVLNADDGFKSSRYDYNILP